jgi:hypothetical protein
MVEAWLLRPAATMTKINPGSAAIGLI